MNEQSSTWPWLSDGFVSPISSWNQSPLHVSNLLSIPFISTSLWSLTLPINATEIVATRSPLCSVAACNCSCAGVTHASQGSPNWYHDHCFPYPFHQIPYHILFSNCWRVQVEIQLQMPDLHSSIWGAVLIFVGRHAQSLNMSNFFVADCTSFHLIVGCQCVN